MKDRNLCLAYSKCPINVSHHRGWLPGLNIPQSPETPMGTTLDSVLSHL